MQPVKNFIAGEWSAPAGDDASTVIDPATNEPLAKVPVDGSDGAAAAVAAAARAYPDWRDVPPGERVQFLFRFKQQLEEDFGKIARLVSLENGKTYAEAAGELRRGIENVEVACGIPTMMQGYNLQDIARGIDETMVRQPLGVVGVITPFNFPVMIPLWF
ncbi:MAG: aldehyde dehydrogenase family protein, partial [Bryobacterales bacterium]|nr:aldehyde dehydrogenase family protein [Bryobacterales bacterium]